MHSANAIQFNQVADNTILEIDNTAAKARISLFGGHVLSFIPKQDNIDRLWMSPLTKVDGSEAIRGGVPVCWPWFSNQFPTIDGSSPDSKLPSHGYARSNLWQIASIECPALDTTEITLTFSLSNKPGFPYEASLAYRITIAKELTLRLEVQNTGEQAFEFTGALHTYFKVNDLANAEVLGLQGKYKDKTQDFAEFDTPAHYKITGETDRVHLTSEPAATIREAQHNTFIDMQRHDSIVVWNPGSEAVKNIGNVPDEAFRQFLCIEAAVTTATEVEANSNRVLEQKIS